MDVEVESRPLSIMHGPRDWHDHSRAPSRPPLDAGSTGSSSSGSMFVTAQRRRSSMVHATPIGPPPNHPIPTVPSRSQTPYGDYDGMPQLDGDDFFSPDSNFDFPPSFEPYTRPSASVNLAAVAAFSQARLASSSTDEPPDEPSPPASESSSRPLGPRPNGTSQRPHQELVPGRLLLSPPEPSTPVIPRPSSRRTLTRALELAREAVHLDSTNDDPYGAVQAYGRSVALLNEVMERVMRGEDSTESSHRRRNGRRRSVVAQEEEVRRLKSIHDTYADRMNILSLIYSIPITPVSPTSAYPGSLPHSTDSTQPPSPSHNSIPLDSDDRTERVLSSTGNYLQPQMYNNDNNKCGISEAGVIGTAMFALDPSGNSGSSAVFATVPSFDGPVHPYATGGTMPSQGDDSSSSSSNRTSTLQTQSSHPASSGTAGSRRRALSALPPPAPPPRNSPPPPPQIVGPVPGPSSPHGHNHFPTTVDDNRPRGNSTGHKRTGSGNRLASLREEVDRYDNPVPPQQSSEYERYEIDRPNSGDTLFAPRDYSREGLPSLPPSKESPRSPVTPRISTPPDLDEQTSRSSSPSWNASRPRGGSSTSLRSDIIAAQHLVSASTGFGTISQRRNKGSAPPSGSTSPSESAISAGSAVPAGRVATSLPQTSALNLSVSIGRNRSASQPGVRPSLLTVNSSPADFPPRPPMPQTAQGTSYNQGNTLAPRKPVVPSRLNPNVPQLHSASLSNLLSPPAALSNVALIPSPVVISLPTMPPSPLPPPQPADPLRKPYHMMSLLRNTMTTKSGGYITRRLHVPCEVWSQGGAKLTNLPEKVRVVLVLCSALEDLQMGSAEFCGAGSVSTGFGLGINSIGRKEGEAWAAKLEEFSAVCDGLVGNFGKKLGVGEGFAAKKNGVVTSWGSKFARQFDKFTNGKNLDSPASYVQDLARLFLLAQLLDEHTKAINSQPLAPVYAALPLGIRTSLEPKLKRSSEFFASVVLTFVIRDLSQLLDKYAKKCEKWLAE